MVQKLPQKRKSPKAASRAKTELQFSLKLIRLLDSTSAQNIVAGRPLKKLAMKVTSETAGEPISQDGFYLLVYRVGSEIHWTDDQTISEEDGSQLSINCRFEVHFLTVRHPSTKEIKEVANAATHCCYPYVRAFIALLLTQMGHPAMVLPLLRIDPKRGMVLMPPVNEKMLRPKTE